MRIWLDVYDNNFARTGEGPIWRVKQAQIKRTLDGAGSFRATCSATDPRALELLDVGRVIRIWGEDAGGRRLMGEGVVGNWRLTEAPDGVGLVIDGPDILEELKRKNTLLARIYNQSTLSAVCASLIALVPGWTVNVEAGIASEIVDARFDGLNVLKAFVEIAERYGLHIRSSLTSSRTLEIGAFGADSGLRVHKIETISSEALRNPALLMVERIQQDRMQESDKFYNVLIPLGAGEGTAALTLARSSRSSPYPIQSVTGPDGATLYYISSTTYPSGLHTTFLTNPAAVVKVGQFKEIAPLSNSETDIENAANALYDAAAEDLARSSVVQETYALTVKNVKETIQPGDKIHINYKAQLNIEGATLTYLNVRDDFYVLTANEQITGDGSSVTLEVSNIDRFERDEAELLFDAVEKIELRNLKPNIAGGPPSPYVYAREIAPTFPAEVPIEITDATLEVLRVRLRIVTGPFRATSTGAAAGGAHRHRIAEYLGGTSGTAPSLYSEYQFAANDEGVGSVIFRLGSSSGDLYTRDSSDAHTHDVQFGIVDDSELPVGVTFHFQGQDVTQDLFGAATLSPSGTAINQLADAGVLANLLRNASGGLRQLHTLEIRCASGRGRIEVTIERFETTQTIRLT